MVIILVLNGLLKSHAYFTDFATDDGLSDPQRIGNFFLLAILNDHADDIECIGIFYLLHGGYYFA